MERRFENKVVVITGGGTGIGRGIAIRLAQEGAEIVIGGRRHQPLDKTVKDITDMGGKAWAHSLDVRSVDEIQVFVDAVIARSGHIDVVVNNAAHAGEGAFLEVTPDYYDEVLDINLRGCYFVAQRCAKAMIANGNGGSIINITSIDGSAADGPFSTYCASKAGLINLTRSMAFELAPHKIRVNAVAPGFTMTEMTEAFVSPEEFEYLKTRFHRVPMRRMGTVEEVAAVVAFLASDEAPYLTGDNITIDGGLTSEYFIFQSFALMNQK